MVEAGEKVGGLSVAWTKALPEPLLVPRRRHGRDFVEAGDIPSPLVTQRERRAWNEPDLVQASH